MKRFFFAEDRHINQTLTRDMIILNMDEKV